VVGAAAVVKALGGIQARRQAVLRSAGGLKPVECLWTPAKSLSVGAMTALFGTRIFRPLPAVLLIDSTDSNHVEHAVWFIDNGTLMRCVCTAI